MNNHQPDNWVVLKFSGDDPHYRILAGWSGSYLNGSSWKLNSGITRVEEFAEDFTHNNRTHHIEYFKFYGSSGSCYVCNKETYQLRMNTASVWAQLEKLHGNKVEMMPEDTDWMTLDWIIK